MYTRLQESVSEPAVALHTAVDIVLTSLPGPSFGMVGTREGNYQD